MQRKQQLTFLAVVGLFWFALYTYPVLLSNHAATNLGATPAMAGMVVGSYGFTQMVLRIPIGFASDRLRRRKTFLVMGMAATALAALGLFLARSAVPALLARGAAGVAASTWVCFTVLFGSMQTEAERSRAMGTLSSLMYAAQLIATLLGGALAQAAGVQASFLLAAVAGFAGLLLATRVTDVPPGAAPVSLSAVVAGLKSRQLLLCSLLSIFLQMIMWATLYGFSPSWAEQVLGADPAQLGMLSTVHLIPTIFFAKVGASWLAPRVGERITVLCGFVCMAVACLLAPLTEAFWQMLCLQALCGIGVGCAAPLLLATCTRGIAPHHQGIAMGTYQSLYGIGMFLGPMLAGWLVGAASPVVEGVAQMAQGYRAVFLASGGIGLLAAVLSLLLPGKGLAARDAG